jgi:aspartate aminotransferase
MPNAGYPQVREKKATKVREEQGVKLSKDNIIMTCGAGGALNVALKTIINPGDTVLVSVPCFVEYQFYADNHGGQLKTVPCLENFDLDIDAIERSIDASTCAIIINSPNNPCGIVYPQETIDRLAALLDEKSKEYGRTIYLVSDEPYRKLVYDNIKVPSLLASYRNTFAATSYSKELSIPGERIGWLVIGPESDDAPNLINGAILSNRILGFVNAPAMMQRVIAKLQGVHVNINTYKHKRDILCNALEEIGYEFSRPNGTFYLFPKAPGGDDLRTVEALQKERILTVPGKGFEYPNYFRITFCVSDLVIERSIEGFERAYRALTKG